MNIGANRKTSHETVHRRYAATATATAVIIRRNRQNRRTGNGADALGNIFQLMYKAFCFAG